MAKEQEKFQEKFQRISENSTKFLSSITDDHLNDFNYIPESMQPYINNFVRQGRLKVDVLSQFIETTDKSSDEHMDAKREMEKVAKSFVNLRGQIDSYKTGMANYKNILGELNKGTQDANYFINSSVFGNQWNDLSINDDGDISFLLGDKKEKMNELKLNSLLDFKAGSAPMITEPYVAKNLVLKMAQQTKRDKDLGRPFNYEWAYNNILNSLTDMGPSETIGMAYTDLAGDGRTKTFSEMYASGLKDENYYKHPSTGENLPQDPVWMKDPANADILNQLLSRYVSDVMKDVYGAINEDTGQLQKSQADRARELIQKYSHSQHEGHK